MYPTLPIDQDSLGAIQSELTPGESVLWAGRPATGIVFHKEDAYLIPFSLMWGGFAIFWEMGVTGHWGTQRSNASPPVFFMLWGVPFVVIGQYLIWGRFFYTAWKKKRTHYAVTTRRVIAVQDGWRRQTASTYIDTLPTLIKDGLSGGSGTLRFAQSQPMWSTNRGWGVWDGMAIGSVPVFRDIPDVDSVYRLVSELRDKATAAKSKSS